MEFKGILRGVVAERSGDSEKGHWERRQYLVEEVASFPKKMVFEISDGEIGRYAKWDALIGKNVCVRFTIDASEYKGKWYNNISAWEVWEPKPAQMSAGDSMKKDDGQSFEDMMKQDAVGAVAQKLNENGEKADDLPF